MSDSTKQADGFEVFCDASYYDMWCVRPSGNRDFNQTIHFHDEASVIHATHAISSWFPETSK